jgi:two-component system, OmpR family, sensor histidine kinase CiaH
MFQSARLKLTGWYLLIVVVICLFFNVGIYRALSDEVDRFDRMQRFRIERSLNEPRMMNSSPFPRRLNIPLETPELVAETKQRILITLIVINSSIIAMAGALSYFLAGKTLLPIAEMMDEQNRFISDASHELKTPLTSLKTSFEVFLRNPKHTLTEAREIMSESIEDVNKLQFLSEALLQLAHYEKPQSRLSFSNIEVEKVVTKAVKKISSVALEKQITIAKTIDQDTTVLGDAQALTDLVVILLDNAVKYSPEKSQVEVVVTRNEHTVTLAVQDHGIGIAAKDIHKIFDRFYRADTARSRTAAGGYGLGLSIAKQLAEIHNGTIAVESSIESGSRFTITFPVALPNSVG